MAESRTAPVAAGAGEGGFAQVRADRPAAVDGPPALA
jgi:hypothetical protein